jgi:hypothetical protein
MMNPLVAKAFLSQDFIELDGEKSGERSRGKEESRHGG